MKTILDKDGLEIPISTLSSIDRKRTAAVEAAVKRAKRLAARIEKDRADIAKIVDQFIEEAFASHGITFVTQKGNTTLLNFSQTRKVVITSPEVISFNEQLQVAIQAIKECLQEWITDGRDELKALFREILNVDKQGKINRALIFRLRKIESADERWQKAKKILDNSFEVVGVKRYVRYYEKNGKGNWVYIDI
jgi:hypothetical protein